MNRCKLSDSHGKPWVACLSKRNNLPFKLFPFKLLGDLFTASALCSGKRTEGPITSCMVEWEAGGRESGSPALGQALCIRYIV